MKYTFEDFMPPRQESERPPATEAERLQKEIDRLKEQVEIYRREVSMHSNEDWFKEHIAQLADEAAKDFPAFLVRQHLDEVVRKMVEKAVEKAVKGIWAGPEAYDFGIELGKALYKALQGRG